MKRSNFEVRASKCDVGLSLLLACVFGLALSGCDADPARSMKIDGKRPTPSEAGPPSGPPPPASALPASPAKRDAEPARPTDDIVHRAQRDAAKRAGPAPAAWAAGCPPPPEASGGPSTFSVTGPCEFEHHGAVACEAAADDFLVTMSRQAAHGATLMVFINVEKYKGPGDYDESQMFVGIQDSHNIYRWSTDQLKITVGPGERFTTLPRTELDPEPVLAQCTGPMDNYQCAGRTDDASMEASRMFVSGTLQCSGGG